MKLGIVFNILWLLQKLWTWRSGMNFVAKLWWVWTLIPQFLAKTTFLVAVMSKFTSCFFISVFYNFVERVMELKLNKTKERIFFMVWQWYFLHRHNLAFQLLWLVRVCIGNCFFTVLACLTQQYMMEMYGAKDIDIVVSSSNFYLKPR